MQSVLLLPARYSSFSVVYFTWQKENNLLVHEKIDEGDSLPRKNLSPIMVSDGVPPILRVKEEFERESSEVDENIRTLVLKVLSEN